MNRIVVFTNDFHLGLDVFLNFQTSMKSSNKQVTGYMSIIN
uniref:Uncharacterized protein n=1 Tax=Arundo donax TaxID=35708 RepID=A0A0A8ZBW8_ARUDO